MFEFTSADQTRKHTLELGRAAPYGNQSNDFIDVPAFFHTRKKGTHTQNTFYVTEEEAHRKNRMQRMFSFPLEKNFFLLFMFQVLHP